MLQYNIHYINPLHLSIIKTTYASIYKTVFLVFIILISSQAFSHGGGLNKDGCHNDRKKGEYHCHNSSGQKNSNNVPKQSAKTNEREKIFNRSFARYLGGKTEVRLNYKTKNNENGYVLIDIITNDYVIEGGLDKRSSLDSLQQAIFASTLTGKKPAIALYDTDQKIGKIEHRIMEASKVVGVTIFWISNGKVEKLLPN